MRNVGIWIRALEPLEGKEGHVGETEGPSPCPSPPPEVLHGSFREIGLQPREAELLLGSQRPSLLPSLP